MTVRLRVVPAALGGVAAALLAVLGASASIEARQRPTLDNVLAEYRSGDGAAVDRAFATSRDFQAFRVAEPQKFDGWLGSWDRAKAVFLLELIKKATEVAPQFAHPLVSSGRRYLLGARRQAEAGGDQSFLDLWHRTALGLLQRSGAVTVAEEHLDIVIGPAGSPGSAGRPRVDSRLVLARAIAQEQRCRSLRAGLDWTGGDVGRLLREADIDVKDPTRPTRGALIAREARVTQCMASAVARFDEAASDEETRAEARVRGAWLLFLQGNPEQALACLEDVVPNGDRDVAYWAALFRGRAFDALGRHAEAADAYRAALDLAPAAQSAGIGLVLALVRLDRVAEADELARALRAKMASAFDPWWEYDRADSRFVGLWIDQLREASR